MGNLKYEKESYQIRGVVFEVYRHMGCGFLEAVYQECMERELSRTEIPFITQPKLRLTYKDEFLNQTYMPDLICYKKIIVEIKAVKELANEHRAQVYNYLRATDLKLAFLVNFGHYLKAQIERIVL